MKEQFLGFQSSVSEKPQMNFLNYVLRISAEFSSARIFSIKSIGKPTRGMSSENIVISNVYNAQLKPSIPLIFLLLPAPKSFRIIVMCTNT